MIARSLSERLEIAARIYEGIAGKSAMSETIREAAALIQHVERAATGTIVASRANSSGGFHLEVAADIAWHSGMRVTIVPLDPSKYDANLMRRQEDDVRDS